MFRSVFLSCFLFIGLQASAQLKTTYTFETASGKFAVKSFYKGVYQVVFQPKGYRRNEQLSDAVITTHKKPAGFRFRHSGDSIFINDKLVITGIVNQNGYNGFKFPLQETEKIFGSGERALPLNRVGYRLNLYNNPWYGYSEGADNLNYSVPFITSSKQYGLFFDNPSKGFLDIGKTEPGVLYYGASSGEINVYIIQGDYAKTLESYHKLTGTQPLPPRWAFGNLMSRFGYTSEAQVREILDKMKKENMPVDAVIFDLFWFGDSIKGTMGNLDWVNKNKWPDPKRMIRDLRNQFINTILVTEPFFVETSKNYESSKPYLAIDSANKPYYLTDFYFGKGGLVDIFRKDAQSWFWQFYKNQMKNGVEAWWGDLGEPEKHPAELYHNPDNRKYKRLFKADEVHNLYGHTWTKMLYQFYEKEYPYRRLFSLNRSGFAGSQRFSIFPWTGDVSRSWKGLRSQLQVLLGMAMSGVPYVHSDAGGFAGGEGDNELYVRWLQLACYTPVFRPHGTALFEKEPAAFSFPSEPALIDSPYKQFAKQVLDVRYRMLPYNYTLAYQQAKYGKPLMAPLYYYYPGDTTALNVEDEFMWGPGFLVAPVLYKSAVTRTYYLPEGKWWNPKKKKFFVGGKYYTDSVDLSYYPVLIKEGSFIPVDGRAIKSANTYAYRTRTVPVMYVVSSKPSTGQLYIDDGHSKNAIAKKEYELITFSTSGRNENGIELNVTSNNGNYEGKPYNSLIVFQLPGLLVPSRLSINGRNIPKSKNNSFNSSDYKLNVVDGEVVLTVKYTGKPITVTFSW